MSTPEEVVDEYGCDKDHFLNVAEHIFGPAAQAAGYEFRAPSTEGPYLIQAEIIRNLEEADLVLCDISTHNANVFFELGIRVALDKPVAMVRDNRTERIPFDNSMINCHMYDSCMDVWKVKQEIPKLQRYLEQAKGQKDNPLWRYFGISQRAKVPDSGNPEEAKLDLILAELNSLRAQSHVTITNRSQAWPHDTGRAAGKFSSTSVQERGSVWNPLEVTGQNGIPGFSDATVDLPSEKQVRRFFADLGKYMGGRLDLVRYDRGNGLLEFSVENLEEDALAYVIRRIKREFPYLDTSVVPF